MFENNNDVNLALSQIRLMPIGAKYLVQPHFFSACPPVLLFQVNKNPNAKMQMITTMRHLQQNKYLRTMILRNSIYFPVGSTVAVQRDDGRS